MVGSTGRLGVLTELTFKVFPQPLHRSTITVQCRDLDDALTTLGELAGGAWDLEALDLEPPMTLKIRLAGHPEPLKGRCRMLSQAIDRPIDILDGDAETDCWKHVSEFDWSEDNACLVKVPLTAAKRPQLENAVGSNKLRRRYTVAGNVAWLNWPMDRSMADLDALLIELHLQGLVIKGDVNRGADRRATVPSLLRSRQIGLDPQGRFPE